MRAFVIAVVLLACGSAPWGAERAGAQGVDSCLELYQDVSLLNTNPQDSTLLNPDSVKYDTCADYIPSWERLWAKNLYLVIFKYYIFDDSVPPEGDTIRQWEQIDTSFQAIRAGMKAIEQRFGHFDLHYQYFPDSVRGYVDTTSLFTRGWYFYFDNYLNVDTALYYLAQIPDTEGGWVTWQNTILEIYSGPKEIVKTSKANHGIIASYEPSSNSIIVRGEDLTIPEVWDMLGRRVILPSRYLSASALEIDLTLTPSNVLFLKFPQQLIPIVIPK